MPNGGSLRLAVQPVDDGRRVEVRIADNGPGIPPEIRERVFEPFFTTKKTGTGLGLSIAYGIMEEHGGTLQAQSPPEGGTTVVISLPASAGVEE
jgi:two-component system NtrC family sensor kinase